MKWDFLWDFSDGSLMLNLITIILIIIGAFALRWVLHFSIERVVQRIVSGAKRKQNVQDTQALVASPLRPSASCNAPAPSARCSPTSSMC